MCVSFMKFVSRFASIAWSPNISMGTAGAFAGVIRREKLRFENFSVEQLKEERRRQLHRSSRDIHFSIGRHNGVKV